MMEGISQRCACVCECTHTSLSLHRYTHIHEDMGIDMLDLTGSYELLRGTSEGVVMQRTARALLWAAAYLI